MPGSSPDTGPKANPGETWGERSRLVDAETRAGEGVDRVVTFDITATELATPSL